MDMDDVLDIMSSFMGAATTTTYSRSESYPNTERYGRVGDSFTFQRLNQPDISMLEAVVCWHVHNNAHSVPTRRNVRWTHAAEQMQDVVDGIRNDKKY